MIPNAAGNEGVEGNVVSYTCRLIFIFCRFPLLSIEICSSYFPGRVDSAVRNVIHSLAIESFKVTCSPSMGTKASSNPYTDLICRQLYRIELSAFSFRCIL